MSDHFDLEERLRLALRSVAELPAPCSVRESTRGGQPGPRPPRRHQRLLIAVASIAALALVVALALTFGPHSSAPPVVHPKTPAPASHPHSHPHPHPQMHGSVTPTTPVTTPVTTTPATPTTPTTPATEQLTYQPFNGSQLDPSLHVAAQESGPCFTYGGGADGRYLYRCGTIQPCFAGSDGTSAPLACPVGANPTTNDVVLWTATSVDATGFVPAPTKTPWAMQLSDGAVCALVNAAWSGLGPFRCNPSAGTGGAGATTGPADCRQPLASTTQWTAECQDQLTQGSPFGVQPVAKIWF